jgi:excisionase family DNA binding protein
MAPNAPIFPGTEWLDADEATTYLRLPTRKALYAAVARGTIPAHRLGRRVRFLRPELDSLLTKGPARRPKRDSLLAG